MKNLKNKFIIFMCSLFVFLTIPYNTVFASSVPSSSVAFSCDVDVYFYDTLYYLYMSNPGQTLDLSNWEYSEEGYVSKTVDGIYVVAHYKSTLSVVSNYMNVSYSSDIPYVNAKFLQYSAPLPPVISVGTSGYSAPLSLGSAYYDVSGSFSNYSSTFYNGSVVFTRSGGYVYLDELSVISSDFTVYGLVYNLSSFLQDFNSSVPTPSSTPSVTPSNPDDSYFPYVTPPPSHIYQPVDSPIEDVTVSFDFNNETTQYEGYYRLLSDSRLSLNLYVNNELVNSHIEIVGSYLVPPVSSLGILSLYGASYYTYDGNIFVNYDGKKYQFLEWSFNLVNAVNPYSTFGTSSLIPISTTLTGDKFYIAPPYETYYMYRGDRVIVSRPSYDVTATLTVNIILNPVEGEIYNPPSNPPSSDNPYIDDNYKPLIPPNDPTLNNPSAPPLSDGSSSLSDNLSGEGFDLNHYLNFNFPVVLSYLGFLFTQCFNFMADNNIFFFSAVAVVVVAAIFIVIRERL